MILCVVAARPNFMKMAPVILELRNRRVPHKVVHTGQHYDAAMSRVFFDELGLPDPDEYLGVGSGSHAEQTGRIMIAFEQVCGKLQPSLVLVAGDVNSTLACALVSAKLCVPVVHLEAGLRSFDRTMPEEINRVLTDHVSDLLMTSEPSGALNLEREGIDPRKVRFVGNCMIDSLRQHVELAVMRGPWKRFGLHSGSYGVVTLHRPAMVDDDVRFRETMEMLAEVANEIPLVFPMHPRTMRNVDANADSPAGMHIVEPLGYLDFLGLLAKARIVITDSGGIQEETTALGVPCVTMRMNTERPVTVECGTNTVAGLDPAVVREVILKEVRGGRNSERKTCQPPLWDGRAAIRVVDAMLAIGA